MAQGPVGAGTACEFYQIVEGIYNQRFRQPCERKDNHLHCIVPFCPKTTKKTEHTTEWICRDHWLPIHKNKRRIYNSMKKRQIDRTIQQRFWERLKRNAIEKAAGI